MGTRKNRLGEAVLTSTHNLCFEQKYENYQGFLSEIFQFLEVKFSIYMNRRVFVMTAKMCRRRRGKLLKGIRIFDKYLTIFEKEQIVDIFQPPIVSALHCIIIDGVISRI